MGGPLRPGERQMGLCDYFGNRECDETIISHADLIIGIKINQQFCIGGKVQYHLLQLFLRITAGMRHKHFN